MHPLIENAKKTVSSWRSDHRHDLTLAVAALCRETLDADGLPIDSPDWAKLRSSFDNLAGQSIGKLICEWDDNCRFADVDLQSDRSAYVKMGIVTWVVKFIAKRFNMLPGSDPIPDFEEWKQRLCGCLDKHILVEKPE